MSKETNDLALPNNRSKRYATNENRPTEKSSNAHNKPYSARGSSTNLLFNAFYW